jgi:hypothetical protein
MCDVLPALARSSRKSAALGSGPGRSVPRCRCCPQRRKPLGRRRALGRPDAHERGEGEQRTGHARLLAQDAVATKPRGRPFKLTGAAPITAGTGNLHTQPGGRPARGRPRWRSLIRARRDRHDPAACHCGVVPQAPARSACAPDGPRGADRRRTFFRTTARAAGGSRWAFASGALARSVAPARTYPSRNARDRCVPCSGPSPALPPNAATARYWLRRAEHEKVGRGAGNFSGGPARCDRARCGGGFAGIPTSWFVYGGMRCGSTRGGACGHRQRVVVAWCRTSARSARRI